MSKEFSPKTRLLPKDYPQMEKSLVVSDIHGRDEHLAEKLMSFAQSENQPNLVVFLGDIVGTESLDKLQKLFYNGVYNHVKKLQKDNPDPTDEQILSSPAENNQTVSQGIDLLLAFLDNIHPRTDSTNKAQLAREIANYKHFGHFCSNLPIEIRQQLTKDMEENARTWIEIMSEFTNKGTFVTVIEGNWDARTPLDFQPTKTECQPLPEEKRQFSFKKLLSSLNQEVFYAESTSVVETENTKFILLPFDSTINISEIPEITVDQRKIVLLSHAQIDWSTIKGNTPMTEEGKTIQSNMGKIIEQTKPNQAAHGHLHQEPNQTYDYQGITVHYLPKGQSQLIEF